MVSLLYYKIRVRISSNITLISHKTLGYKPIFKNKIKKENRLYWTKAFISIEDRLLEITFLPLLYPQSIRR